MAKKSKPRSYKPTGNRKYTVSGNYGVYTKDGSYYNDEGRTKNFPKMTPVKVQQVYTTTPKPQLQKSASTAVSQKAANMAPTNVKSARKAAKATVKAAKATVKAEKTTAKTNAKAAKARAKTAKKVTKIAKKTVKKVSRIDRRKLL